MHYPQLFNEAALVVGFITILISIVTAPIKLVNKIGVLVRAVLKLWREFKMSNSKKNIKLKKTTARENRRCARPS